MIKDEQNVNIKSLAENERPREKLMMQGRRQLSDAELMAILIGSGSRTESSVALCQRILASYNNDLDVLAGLSVRDLSGFKGIGEAKALCIVAALEIGRRRKKLPRKKMIQITRSKDIFAFLLPVFADLNHEEFWIVTLNKANYITGKHMISKGGQTGTVADPKIIFKTALDQKAAYLILAHNHPSGNLKPSEADISVTKQLVEAGRLLDLHVLDHLIITNKGYCSLADEAII